MKKLKTGHSDPSLRTSTLWYRFILEAIERTGVDSRAVATEIGLDLARLEHTESYIEDEYTALLLMAASEMAGDREYGLICGRYFVPSAFGPLGYSMMTCNTLQQALERSVQFTASMTSSTNIRFHSSGGHGSLEVIMPAFLPEVTCLVEDFVMTTILTSLRWLIGRDFCPLAVEFTHDAPISESKYVQTFAVSPVFSSARCRLQFSRQDLDSRVIFSDTAMADIHDQYAAQRSIPYTATPINPQIRRIIRQHLHDGELTLALVAQQLHISERTLQRRLKRELGSFHEILDEVRKELLQLYLADTSIPFKDVARRLGFADQSSFTRIVHRWHGQTPKTLRVLLNP